MLWSTCVMQRCYSKVHLKLPSNLGKNYQRGGAFKRGDYRMSCNLTFSKSLNHVFHPCYRHLPQFWQWPCFMFPVIRTPPSSTSWPSTPFNCLHGYDHTFFRYLRLIKNDRILSSILSGYYSTIFYYTIWQPEKTKSFIQYKKWFANKYKTLISMIISKLVILL